MDLGRSVTASSRSYRTSDTDFRGVDKSRGWGWQTLTSGRCQGRRSASCYTMRAIVTPKWTGLGGCGSSS